MTIGTLGAILQQALDGLRRHGKRIRWGRLLNYEVVSPWHEKPKIEQLMLMVELGETHSSHAKSSINQVLAARYGQLAGIQSDSSLSSSQLNHEIKTLLFQTH